ncbi:cation channel sperm-associated auxiliary subunit delta-like isoform X2 [Antedon mediterranea]|uniref:cation channel sperm-associated auxiliary subunit delta-like isoform X2 n=1 Tax=Antedon mediterranea TaxID=105859 RepID=UPI003AF50EB1
MHMFEQNNYGYWPLPSKQVHPSSMNGSVILNSNMTITSLIQHPCDLKVSVILSNYLYVTKDAFQTPVFPLSVPINILQSDDSYVTCVAFIKDTLLLAVSGEVLVVNLHTMNATRGHGISEYINWIVTSPCCYTEDTSWCVGQNSIVFAFNSEIITDDPLVWWSNDGGHLFQQVTVSHNYQGPFLISGVFLHPLKHKATLLMQVDYSYTVMKNFNYLASQVQDGSETIPFPTKGVYMPATQLNYRSESFIFLNESTIYYSPVSGAAMRPVKLNGLKNKTHLNPGEDIVIINSGYKDYFLLVTNQHRVFLGREEGMKAEVTEILQNVYHSGVGLAFGDHNNIHLYTAWNRENASSIHAVEFHKKTYKIHNLVDLQNSAPCKYQAILNNYEDHIFYLDIAMEMNLSITMYSEPWQQTHFIVFVSNPDLLQFSSEVTPMWHSTTRGVTTNSMTTLISLRVDKVSESTVDGVEGMGILKMGSLEGSLTCLQDQYKESLVIGGCPPGRQIRVKKRDTACENWRGASYTIRKDLYDPTFLLGRTTGTQDRTLTYDLEQVGCPFLVHIADPFKPIIELFDGDKFVEEVLVNFVVYDINGRFTFTYTMTMAEALCVSQAQDRLTMLQAQSLANPHTAWTNKNFLSCYDDSGSPLVHSEKPYEIMNSSSSNKIKWLPYSGLYIFNVTVVDPNYSFCTLTALFAVEVYGALPEAPFPQMHIMLGICGFGVLSLWFMYGTYSIMTKPEEQNKTE